VVVVVVMGMVVASVGVNDCAHRDSLNTLVNAIVVLAK
jgi:hypothetical protein